jgi:ABC-type multidrug transport system ATPase subunit
MSDEESSERPLLFAEAARVMLAGAVALDDVSLTTHGDRLVLAGDYRPLLHGLTAGASAPEIDDVRIANGRLELAGLDVARGDHLAIAGFALADLPIPLSWSARQYLEWSARLAGCRRRDASARASSQLARLGFRSSGGLAMSTLSPVERRLTAIAQAIVVDPTVLVVDNPFSRLDARGVAAVVAALHEATRERRALVCLPRLSPSGAVGDLVRAATHLCLFRSGQLYYSGSPKALLAGSGVFAITVSRNADALRGELTRLGAEVHGGPLHFSVAMPEPLAVPDILAAAAKSDAAVLSCVPIEHVG